MLGPVTTQASQASSRLIPESHGSYGRWYVLCTAYVCGYFILCHDS